MAEPSIRSSVERTFFGLFSELPEAAQKELEARTEPAVYRAARTASLLGWTPMTQAVAIRDALRTVVGDAGFVSLIEAWSILSITRPPFKLISDAIFRIYDRKPLPLLRGYGSVWSAVYRNVGDYELVHAAPNHAIAHVRDPCPQARAPAFAMYTLGTLAGVVQLGSGFDVQAGHRVRDTQIEFELRWKGERDTA